MTTPRSLLDTLVSDKQLQLTKRSAEKQLNLGAKKSPTDVPWEDISAANAGLKLWNEPNAAGVMPRLGDDDTRAYNLGLAQEGQPDPENPMVQVQRDPTTGKTLPYRAIRNPYTGQDLTATTFNPGSNTSLERDAFDSREQLRAAKASITGEEFIPREYDASQEAPYDPLAYTDNPGDQHYTPNKKRAWKQSYSNKEKVETLYTGERRPRFDKEKGNLQQEHTSAMAWYREQRNAQDGTDLDRKDFQETSAEANRFEGDPRMFSPVTAGMNKFRGTMPYGEVEGNSYLDANKTVKVDTKKQIIEPRDEVKGEIARQLLSAETEYGLDIPNRDVIAKWNKKFRPSEEERLLSYINELNFPDYGRNEYIKPLSDDELITALKNPDNQYAKQGRAAIRREQNRRETEAHYAKRESETLLGTAKNIGASFLGSVAGIGGSFAKLAPNSTVTGIIGSMPQKDRDTYTSILQKNRQKTSIQAQIAKDGSDVPALAKELEATTLTQEEKAWLEINQDTVDTLDAAYSAIDSINYATEAGDVTDRTEQSAAFKEYGEDYWDARADDYASASKKWEEGDTTGAAADMAKVAGTLLAGAGDLVKDHPRVVAQMAAASLPHMWMLARGLFSPKTMSFALAWASDHITDGVRSFSEENNRAPTDAEIAEIVAWGISIPLSEKLGVKGIMGPTRNVNKIANQLSKAEKTAAKLGKKASRPTVGPAANTPANIKANTADDSVAALKESLGIATKKITDAKQAKALGKRNKIIEKRKAFNKTSPGPVQRTAFESGILAKRGIGLAGRVPAKRVAVGTGTEALTEGYQSAVEEHIKTLDPAKTAAKGQEIAYGATLGGLIGTGFTAPTAVAQALDRTSFSNQLKKAVSDAYKRPVKELGAFRKTLRNSNSTFEAKVNPNKPETYDPQAAHLEEKNRYEQLVAAEAPDQQEILKTVSQFFIANEAAVSEAMLAYDLAKEEGMPQEILDSIEKEIKKLTDDGNAVATHYTAFVNKAAGTDTDTPTTEAPDTSEPIPMSSQEAQETLQGLNSKESNADPQKKTSSLIGALQALNDAEENAAMSSSPKEIEKANKAFYVTLAEAEKTVTSARDKAIIAAFKAVVKGRSTKSRFKVRDEVLGAGRNAQGNLGGLGYINAILADPAAHTAKAKAKLFNIFLDKQKGKEASLQDGINRMKADPKMGTLEIELGTKPFTIVSPLNTEPGNFTFESAENMLEALHEENLVLEEMVNAANDYVATLSNREPPVSAATSSRPATKKPVKKKKKIKSKKEKTKEKKDPFKDTPESEQSVFDPKTNGTLGDAFISHMAGEGRIASIVLAHSLKAVGDLAALKELFKNYTDKQLRTIAQTLFPFADANTKNRSQLVGVINQYIKKVLTAETEQNKKNNVPSDPSVDASSVDIDDETSTESTGNLMNVSSSAGAAEFPSTGTQDVTDTDADARTLPEDETQEIASSLQREATQLFAILDQIKAIPLDEKKQVKAKIQGYLDEGKTNKARKAMVNLHKRIEKDGTFSRKGNIGKLRASITNPALHTTFRTLANAEYVTEAALTARQKLLDDAIELIQEGKIPQDQINAALVDEAFEFYKEHGWPAALNIMSVNAFKGDQQATVASRDFQSSHKVKNLLSQVPDLLSTIRLPKLWAKVAGLRDMVSGDMYHAQNSLGEFHDKFAAAYYERYGTDIEPLGGARAAWNKSPLLAFKDVVTDNSGAIPENMMVAMAWSSYSLLASRMQSTLLTTPSEIKNIFGMQDHEQITEEGAAVLSTSGIPASALYRMFGKTALDLIGLEGKTNAKLPRIQALQQDMGMVMLHVLSDMNLIDMTFIERGAINKFTNNAKTNMDYTSDKGVWFARVATTPENDFDTTAGVKNIVGNYHATNGTKDTLKKLLDLNTDEDTPELAPIKKVSTRVKRTLMSVAKKAQEVFKKTQASAWTSDTQIADFVTNSNIKDSVLLTRLLGIREGKEGDLSKIPLTQRLSQEARNQALRREFDLFINHRAEVKKQPWYLRSVNWVNGRSGPKSVINPQTYKHTHRALASKPAWKRELTFDAGFHMPALQGGIMSAFGMGSDKNFLPDILSHFESQVMYMENEGVHRKGDLREGVYKEVLGLYEKAEKQGLTLPETNRFMEIVDEHLGGEGLEVINGLIALRDMSTALRAGKKSMTVDLHTEIDGVTNGVINAVLQLGIEPARAQEILAAGGVYTSAKDGNFEFGQPHANKAARDNYEELAARIYTRLAQQEALIDPNDTEGQAMFQALNALGPEFHSKTKASGISSEGRDFTKYPLMLIVYGASLASITKAQAEETLEKIYTDLGKIQAKKDAAANPAAKAAIIRGDQAAMIGNLLTVMGGDISFGIEGGTTTPNSLSAFQNKDFDLYNIRFSKETEEQLLKALKNHFGTPTSEALTDFFGDLIKHRDVANTFFNIQQKAYKLFWEKGKEELLQKYDAIYLTSRMEDELKKDLRERGIVPGIAGPLSDKTLTGKDGFSDQIQTTKYEMFESGDRSAEVVKQNKNTSTHKLVSVNSQGWVKVTPNGKQMGNEILSRIPIIAPKEILGALGYVMVNQNLDGANVIGVTDEHPDVNSVFDAFLMSILEANAVGNTANEKMWDIARDFNLFEEIDTRLQHLQKILQEEAAVADKAGVPSINTQLTALMSNTRSSARSGNKSMKIDNYLPDGNPIYFSTLEDFTTAFHGSDGVSGVYETIQNNWSTLRDPNDGIKRFNNFPHGVDNAYIVPDTTTKIPAKDKVTGASAVPASPSTDVTKDVKDASNTEVNRPIEPLYIRQGNSLIVEGEYHALIFPSKNEVVITRAEDGKTIVTAPTEAEALQAYNELLAMNPKKNLDKAIDDDTSGSSPGAAADLEWFTPAYDKTLTVQNMLQIFNRLGEEWYNQKDSVQHADYLTSLLKTTMVPILTKLDDPDITIHIGTSNKKSQGQATVDHVYVAGSKDTLLTQIYMSPQEVMMHELVHTFLRNALKDQRIQDEAIRLFRLAKRVVTIEDFLRRDSNGEVIIGQSYQQELDAANRRYNYVFNNKKNMINLTHGRVSLTGLNEFVAFGLTNEAFKNRLLALDQNSNYNKVLGKGLIPALWALFNNAITFFHRLLNRKKDTNNVHNALLNLAQDAHGIQKKHEYKLDKWVGKIKPLDNVVSKGIDYAFRNVYAPYVKSRRGKTDAHLARRTMDTLITLPYDITVGAFREGIHRMMYNYKFNRDNALYSMLNEMDPTGEGKIPTEYNTLALKATSEQGNKRETTALDVSTDIRSRFDPGNMPGDAAFISLEAALLKTNSAKLKTVYSQKQIVAMFTDKPKLKAEIDRWEQKLSVASRDSFNYQAGQLENLGLHMATGIQGIPAPMKNAFIIGNNLLTGMAMGANTDREAAVVAGDVLASLWAIHYTDGTHLEIAATIASHEASRAPEGEDAIAYMLTMAESAEQQSFEKSFKGNRIHMAQGYTADIYSEYVDVKLGLLSDEVKFNEHNYHLMPNKFILDPNSSFKKKLYFYASNTSEVGQSVNGGLSKKDQRARGFGTDSIYSINTGRPANAGTAAVRNAVQEQTRLNNIQIKRQFKRRIRPDLTKNYMTPVVSITAKKVVDYTYNLTEQEKVELFKKKNTAPDVLGKMHGSLIDSLATDKYNKEFIDLIKQTYDEDGSAFKSEFIFIGPTAEKQEYKNMWSVLPRKTKEYIQEVFGIEGMYIHDSVLRITMGFQKGSLIDWTSSKVPIPRPVRETLKHAGNIWEQIVSRQKRHTVQLTPQVVISNIVNNQTLSMLYDVPPVYMLKQETEAITLIRTYLEDITLMERLKRENYVEKDLGKKRRIMKEISVLQQRLESNDIHYLFDKGAFQNLAEDFKTEEGGLAKAIKNALPIFEQMSATASGAVPKSFEKIYDEYVMSPNTDASKVMAHAVQYSDFVSRYAMFKYKTEEEGMSKSDAFDLVMKVFIDYETPSSVQMDWLNRNGILQYTKFMFRFQRVLAEVAKNAPGRLLALEMIDYMGVHIPSPLDSLLTGNAFISHGSLPFSGEILDKAFLEDNLFNQLQYVFNPFGLIADS